MSRLEQERAAPLVVRASASAFLVSAFPATAFLASVFLAAKFATEVQQALDPVAPAPVHFAAAPEFVPVAVRRTPRERIRHTESKRGSC